MHFIILIIFIFIITLSFLIYATGKSFLTTINYYLEVNPKIYWLSYVFIQLGFISLIFFPFRLPYLINSYWMAFMFYFIIFSAIAFIIKLLPIKSMFKIIDISKFIFTIIIVIIGIVNANHIQIVSYEVNINKEIPDMNIVVFSDIHLGFRIGHERIERIVQKTNQLQPDLVLIPGDIFDSSFYFVRDIDKIIQELQKIESTYGVFATLGNHDMMGYEDQIRNFLTQSNINLLEDEIAILDHLILVGRIDMTPIVRPSNFERASIPDLLKNINQDLPIIVIDHQPFDIQSGIDNDVDLFVAAHSHNGQVFPGSLVTNLLFLVGYGHQIFNNTHVVVTSGVSFWGPPIRIGTISEIVHIKLTSN